MTAALLFLSLQAIQAALPGFTPGSAELLAPSYALGDFDGDGLADVYVVDPGAGDALFRNRGDGSFEDVTEAVGLADGRGAREALWQDFDGDGWLDLYLSSFEGPSRLLQNLGGAFADVSDVAGLDPASAGELAAAWLDYDADGRPDLLTATAGGDRFLHNLGTGRFERVELVPPRAQVGAAARGLSGPAGEGALATGAAPDDRARTSSAAPTRGAWGPLWGPWTASRASPGSGTLGFSPTCAQKLRDIATASCSMEASSTPLLGALHPLSVALNVTPGGSVGMGITTPEGRLHVLKGSAGSMTANTNSAIVAENSTSSYVSILSPDASERGVIFGEPSNNSAGSILYNSPNAQDGLDFRTNGGVTRMIVDANGKLGVGTSTPAARLDLVGGADGDGLNDPVALGFEHRLGGFRHFLRTRHDAAAGSAGNAIDVYLNNSTTPAGSSAPGVGSIGVLTINASSANRLQVSGGIELDSGDTSTGASSGPMLRFGGASSGEGVLSKRSAGGNQYDLELVTAGVGRLVVTNGGNVGIGTGSATPTDRLQVAGSTRTTCLTITGGCDLAEPFDLVGTGLEPGMLVTIDPEREGQLRLTSRAYDTAVAGVISGAGGVKPGMTMKQEGALDTGEMVALAGRVYCWCDASTGAIRPGDLLTASDVPGHAMRAADRERASGAVVGKALSALAEGRGLVLIVVSLQ